MRLILFGAPGSGKGTQAKMLSQRQRLEHISTGDLLRDSIRRQTPTGVKARSFVEAGQLAPDDVVNELIADRFRTAQPPTRFVMDGYPRTLAQAASFDQLLRQQFLDLTAVLLLKVDDEEIVKRLSGRWSCPNNSCKATYHTITKPPRVAGVCDECGSKLVQRADDRPETIRARLVVYHKDTVELIPHYKSQALLREVPAVGDIEQIYANILKAVNQAKSSC